MPDSNSEPNNQTSVRTTDTEHAWTVDHTGEHWRVRSETHRADHTVSGTASDLLLALWGRTGTEALTVAGDVEALDTLITAAETE